MHPNITERSYETVTDKDLRRLLSLAQSDIESFFFRKPRYAEYKGTEKLVVLAQGGALHYIDKVNGIKDFDVWLFYPQLNDLVLPYRRRGVVDYGDSRFGKHPDDTELEGRKVDILMRSDASFNSGTPGQCIERYLSSRKSKTAKMLSLKPMIGLFPEHCFGQVLWNGKVGLQGTI